MKGNLSKAKGFKGDTGDAFKYEDFTPEQLESLRGYKGDKGDSPAIVLRYDEATGNLYYNSDGIMADKEYVESQNLATKEEVNGIAEVVKSDVEGLRKQITEEAHFRGYLSSNAKIQALNATPNDFAYSAESGTKWVYDEAEGWKDTGAKVPDQLTPASDSTPLINGVASAGTEEAYARGDHRHPTDTTRASAEELNNLKAEVASKGWTTLIDTTLTEEQAGVSSIKIEIPDVEKIKTMTRMRFLVSVQAGEEAIASQSMIIGISDFNAKKYNSFFCYSSGKCDAGKTIMCKGITDFFSKSSTSEFKEYITFYSSPSINDGANAVGNATKIFGKLYITNVNINPPYFKVYFKDGGIMAAGTKIFVEVQE